jgi:hypothetical protein
MSARVDATSSRVQSALTTKKVTKSMEGVVKVSQSPFFFLLRRELYSIQLFFRPLPLLPDFSTFTMV